MDLCDSITATEMRPRNKQNNTQNSNGLTFKLKFLNQAIIKYTEITYITFNYI